MTGSGVPTSEIAAMMTLVDRLENCQYLLARAWLTGDDDAVRRFSEYRLILARLLASILCLATVGVAHPPADVSWKGRSSAADFSIRGASLHLKVLPGSGQIFRPNAPRRAG
ncbi:hypothetical protein FFI94_031585 [Rhodococcus sp. KBS0724]|nr:hypothetical protein FFI94_031585 [Rhodococcus sp. KBS0724]